MIRPVARGLGPDGEIGRMLIEALSGGWFIFF